MGVFGSVMDIGHSTGPLAGGVISGYYGFGNCFLAASLALLAIPIPVFYATICFSSLKFLQPSSIAQKLSFFVSI